MSRDISIAITAKDNFTQTIATMRSSTQAFNKDMDVLRDKLNALSKKKIELKIDTIKANFSNINRDLNAVADNAKKAKKNLDDFESAASKAGNKAGSSGSFNTNTGLKGGSVANSMNTGDFLKKFGSMATDTLSKGVSTYMTSALGTSEGAMFKSTMESGINGAEIGMAAGGPIGAAVGLAIGIGFGAITGAIENYAAEDEKFKSYVKGQYENIVKNRSNSINTSSSLAASKENADDPSSFTAKTKSLNDAKGNLDLAMGNAYNSKRENGKGGLNDQINFYNGKNGEKLQKLNAASGKWEAELANEKDRYQMDAQNALFGGKITKRFSKEERTQLKEYQSKYKKAEAAYDKGDTSQAATMRQLLEATNALASNAYRGSNKAQKEKKSDEALIKSLQASGKKSDKGWKNVSDIEQLLSKGRASVGYNGPIKWDKRNGKMAYGLSYVPYNNFPALLHEGERVLTASENRGYKTGTGVTITGNSFTVREEADINKVARALFREIEKARMVMAN